MLRELLFQHAARLDEQASVDRFGRHPKSLLARVGLRKPPRDLRRRPIVGEFRGNQIAQHGLPSELAALRSPGVVPGPPVGRRGTVASYPTMPSDLSTDRRRLPADPACDLTQRGSRGQPTGYLFTFVQPEHPRGPPSWRLGACPG